MNFYQILLILASVLCLSIKGVVIASDCSSDSLDVLGADYQQGLIKIVDATTYGEKDAKKVTSIDAILVEGLTPELFKQIVQNPELIAEIMGGKLISIKSKSDFVLEIPGILGFDLRFNSKVRVLSEDKLSVELSDFNTFFYNI